MSAVFINRLKTFFILKKNLKYIQKVMSIKSFRMEILSLLTHTMFRWWSAVTERQRHLALTHSNRPWLKPEWEDNILTQQETGCSRTDKWMKVGERQVLITDLRCHNLYRVMSKSYVSKPVRGLKGKTKLIQLWCHQHAVVIFWKTQLSLKCSSGTQNRGKKGFLFFFLTAVAEKLKDELFINTAPFISTMALDSISLF